ncbi:Protein CBG23290 [Caenorhabditis briggsae]|uniref:Protein CBG23290 n=1 Tax=Caenorhabditis briggsae TaxID=6238 RepID=A8Y495_CAEBR|nr:Protein CBG23290 [Caenorhabditis briggsae]CAP39715.2 Protein CBG23290 [Caenorhabditis briggsae]
MILFASLLLILAHFTDARSFKGESETTNESLMKMVDNEWMDKFIPREYKKSRSLSGSGEQDVTKDNNFGFSEQGMKDLDEVGGLVGGGDSDLLGILRPYYSMVEMTANGNKQVCFLELFYQLTIYL